MSDNSEMSFWDHLEVLRWSFFRVLIALVVVFLIAFAFMPHIFDSVILSPSKSDFFVYTWLSGLFPPGFNIDIININVTTPFFTHMKVSLWMSLLLIFPYLLFEIWLFVAPALYDGEKKSVKLAFLGVWAFILNLPSSAESVTTVGRTRSKRASRTKTGSSFRVTACP